MQLTEAQKEQYLRHDGCWCPLCNEAIYFDGEPVTQPNGELDLPARCVACGAKFTERLKLEDVWFRT